MKNKKILKFLKENLLFILILSLFLVTRLYKIDQIPGSVYWDEASIGYNAYSVLKTGKDEWGETLPLHFRAFGEFKLPVYVYSVVFSEALFGLTPLAVRLPAVMYGMLVVVGLYLLVMAITREKKTALLSSFLFTITPWFFIFSRAGYEATAGLAFFIWGVYLFVWFKDEKWKVIFSVISFLLSFYSYNSFRILSVAVLFFVFGYLLLKKRFLPLAISLLIFLGGILPLYKLYVKDSGLSRLYSVGRSENLVTSYFKNYSYNFLFAQGDRNPRSQIPGSPELYLIDLPFLLFGAFYVFQNVRQKKYWYLVFPALLILAPVPAALTKENPHALRSILSAPMLATFSAFGITKFSMYFKKRKKLAIFGIVVIYLLFFLGYFNKFISQYNFLSQNSWQYPYKVIFDENRKVCVGNEDAQPYIFALFYQKVDPEYFRETKVVNPVSEWGYSTIKSFGDFHFYRGCYE